MSFWSLTLRKGPQLTSFYNFSAIGDKYQISLWANLRPRLKQRILKLPRWASLGLVPCRAPTSQQLQREWVILQPMTIQFFKRKFVKNRQEKPKRNSISRQIAMLRMEFQSTSPNKIINSIFRIKVILLNKLTQIKLQHLISIIFHNSKANLSNKPLQNLSTFSEEARDPKILLRCRKQRQPFSLRPPTC